MVLLLNVYISDAYASNSYGYSDGDILSASEWIIRQISPREQSTIGLETVDF